MLRRAALLALLLLPAATAAAATAAASAAPVETFQIQTLTGPNLWRQTSWIPFAVDETHRAVTLRHGDRSWRGIWVPATISNRSTTAVLESAWRNRRGIATAVIADRRLTRREQRRFTVVADLFRDADVLAVAAGHPACAGLTTAQARAVAHGDATRWSEVVAGAPADPIRVRYPADGDVPETRFGEQLPRGDLRTHKPYAPGAKATTDGGLGAAAAGDRTVAAITSWTRARRFGASVCAIPLDGVAPTDDSVRALSYPRAYPVTYVRPRKGMTPFKLAMYDAMQRLFASEAFAGDLAGLGVVLPQPSA